MGRAPALDTRRDRVRRAGVRHGADAIGAAITRNEAVYQAMLRFAQARLCPPSIEQKAAIAAYKMGMGYFEAVRREYERRRNVLYEGLAANPGVNLGRLKAGDLIRVPDASPAP